METREKVYLALIAILGYVIYFKYDKKCPECKKCEEVNNTSYTPPILMQIPVNPSPIIRTENSPVKLEDVEVYKGPEKFMFTDSERKQFSYYMVNNEYFRTQIGLNPEVIEKITQAEMISAWKQTI